MDVLLPAVATRPPLRAALGELPAAVRLVPLEALAEPGEEALGAEVVVFGFELRHLTERLSEFPHLRLVQTLNAGIEWLLPHVPAGVTLCNASGVHDIPVAEWVVAAILAMERRLPQFWEHQRGGVLGDGARSWPAGGRHGSTVAGVVKVDR